MSQLYLAASYTFYFSLPAGGKPCAEIACTGVASWHRRQIERRLDAAFPKRSSVSRGSALYFTTCTSALFFSPPPTGLPEWIRLLDGADLVDPTRELQRLIGGVRTWPVASLSRAIFGTWAGLC